MRDGFIKSAVASPFLRVADCDANAKEIINIAHEAARDGAVLILFPELCVTAYTCGDLFLQDALISGAEQALGEIIKGTASIDALIAVGVPVRRLGKLYNCAAVIKGGRLLGIVPKVNIPNYDEHNELRYFASAPKKNGTVTLLGESVPFGKNLIFACDEINELRVAVEICEDLHVCVPPSCAHSAAGATVIFNLSASSEVTEKDEYRRMLVTSQSASAHCCYMYANAGEGESTTDLVFSGHSMIAEDGKIIAERLPFDSSASYIITEPDILRCVHQRQRWNSFEISEDEAYITVPFSLCVRETKLTRNIDSSPFLPNDRSRLPSHCETVLTVEAKGLARRIEAARTKKCIIGISGGLDSCLALLAAARAMDMLGRPHSDIIALTMPCFGTTARTRNNAEVLCRGLGTDFRCVDIGGTVNSHFKDIGHDAEKQDVVYENSQARIRTLVLMDIANKENGLVVGTGDLSELVLGWATYNGDHMSMYSVNASVPKTLIRQVVSYVADKYESEGRQAISQVLRDILATPVSPELLPANEGEISQITEDLVGPYELHDFHIYYMLFYGFSPRKLFRLSGAAFGDIYGENTRLKWLEVLVKRFFTQQFKRSCLPDGPKVTQICVSPRGSLSMPSDAVCSLWQRELDELKKQINR